MNKKETNKMIVGLVEKLSTDKNKKALENMFREIVAFIDTKTAEFEKRVALDMGEVDTEHLEKSLISSLTKGINMQNMVVSAISSYTSWKSAVFTLETELKKRGKLEGDYTNRYKGTKH